MIGSRKNNSGLSLVELIIAIAIFAIAGLGVAAFMSFGSKNFSISNKNVKLQYEQQVVVNRIRDIVLETSRGISYSDSAKTLYVFGDDSATSNPYVTRLRFDDGESKLYIADNVFAKGTTFADVTSWVPGTEYLLSDSVKEFEVDLSELKNNKVLMTITFAVGDKEVTVSPEISLRNIITEVDDSTNIDKLYKEVIIEVDSKIKDVVISRDGNIFAQGRTDTIAMAGNSTTVDYDAVVNIKKYYTGEVNTAVEWSIDPSSVNEGYGQCISIDAEGRVTVKNSGGKTPADYMKSGGFFVIKATSVADDRKYAKLRIKVTGNGVYPESISFNKTKETPDKKNGLLKYKISNSIKYTGQVKDPTTNKMVNPLTGDGAYSKITYSIKEQIAGSVTIPKGAGFSTTTTDGEFIAVKSMEGQTYTIVATVIQKGKNGQVVSAEYKLTVGTVPEIEEDETELKLLLPATMNRNVGYTPSVSWSNGAPYYEDGSTRKQYYYWYDWKVELVDKSKDSTPASISFANNVYFKYKVTENWQQVDKKSQTVTNLGRSNNILPLYIDAPLDWNKAFAVKVTVTAKVSKTNNINNVEKEYTTEASSTIPKVALSLKPVSGISMPNIYDYPSPVYVTDVSNEPSITFKKSTSENRDYYMMFEPTFTGIKLEANDIAFNSWETTRIRLAVKKDFKIAGNAAASLYMQWPDKHWQYMPAQFFDNGVMKPNNGSNFYFYLKLVKPYSWKDFDAMRWYCRVQGPEGDPNNVNNTINEIAATFPTGNDYMAYKLRFIRN